MPGIIPTRVGTSYCADSRFDNCWDHPHACGDKSLISISALPGRGSSPRVWGQVCVTVSAACNGRIIPTRVGTRINASNFCRSIWDHPHACGDKGTKISEMTADQGSSPRVWGQVDRSRGESVADRIIPTRVGTSSS